MTLVKLALVPEEPTIPPNELIPPKIAAFCRLLRRMALSSKILSPTCAPAHGDIATYFFFEKIFRSDGGMCVSVASFWMLFFSTDFFETLK